MKKIFTSILTLALLLPTSFVPSIVSADNPHTASITINTLTDDSGVHTLPFVFACPQTPLYNPVTISGSGTVTNPAGNINQYHYSIDWGDGSPMSTGNTFTGNDPYSFTFNLGPHTYATTSNFTISAIVYHQTSNGHDTTDAQTIPIIVCVHVPPPTNGSVTVNKIVNGGTAQVSNFTLKVGNTTVTSGLVGDFLAGSYTISETGGPSGYTGVVGGDCAANGSLTVVAGSHYDCTITNTFTNVPPPPPVLGCMDPAALNYNSLATQDDGSCTFPVLGCTNPTATNYNPNATPGNANANQCTFPVPGCTNPAATNYNSLATVDDGSCTFPPPPIAGCTNPVAINFNPNATTDDGSCMLPVLGCTNPAATNYNPLATVGNANANQCTFPPAPVLGCMDPLATNYNPLATQDDGSCTLPPTPVLGCTDSTATNFNPLATPGNANANQCTFPPAPVLGCTNSAATNYNSLATQDDGSCTLPAPVIPPSGGGGGGGGGGGNGPVNFGFTNGGGGSVLGASIGPIGEVLGDSCGLYMSKHLRLGSKKNDSTQVMKLQEFLNKHLGANLPVTGFYGNLTVGAVKTFQEKYTVDVLSPWNERKGTGLVYISTLRQINKIECPELTSELPPLVPWSQNPNAQ